MAATRVVGSAVKCHQCLVMQGAVLPSQPPDCWRLSLTSTWPGSKSLQQLRQPRQQLAVTRLVNRMIIAAGSADLLDSLPATVQQNLDIVNVELGERSYPIYVGAGLLNQPHFLQRYKYF